jgi:hypothetical protein
MDLLNLYLEAVSSTELRIMVTPDTAPQRYVVADIYFEWDPNVIQLDSVSFDTAHPLIWDAFSGFPGPDVDYSGVNEAPVPQDGNAVVYIYNLLGANFIVDQPTEIGRLKFNPLVAGYETTVNILKNIHIAYPVRTVIYGSNVPGVPVTGTLTGATLVKVMGDVNNDMVVNSQDMTTLLANWGVVSFTNNPCDLDGNGQIGSEDLLIMLNNWS